MAAIMSPLKAGDWSRDVAMQEKSKRGRPSDPPALKQARQLERALSTLVPDATRAQVAATAMPLIMEQLRQLEELGAKAGAILRVIDGAPTGDD